MSSDVVRFQIHTNLYRDSVALMSMAAELERRTGVEKAGIVMATPANLDVLARSKILPEDITANPDDLLVVVQADSEETAQTALESAKIELTSDVAITETNSVTFLPKTVDEAVSAVDAKIVTISVPGAYAGAVAEDALHESCHVFCFSDNVPVDEENRLKEYAAKNELLFMGPDCGTAIIDGTPLGFANVLPEGEVGIVAASGTGAQEDSTLIGEAGIGISQIIGVGGRDLSGKIDHPASLVAVNLLENDPKTKLIAVISKHPDKNTMQKLLTRLSLIKKPVIACFMGATNTDTPFPIRGTLQEAAMVIAEKLNRKLSIDLPEKSGVKAYGPILGLYTGGTLAQEASVLLKRFGVEGKILDLGDDKFTRGKPHPMISPDLRAKMISKVSDTDLLLLDVVLGWGSAIDPATPVAEAVAKAVDAAKRAGRNLQVLASITGTAHDPQGLASQRKILQDAGIVVFPSNAAAVTYAIELVKKD